MSKMSQLHAELDSQAAEFGFESLDEAVARGYEIDYTEGRLVPPEESAHKAWLRQKNGLIIRLGRMSEDLRVPAMWNDIAMRELWMKDLNEAIEFIERSKM